VTDNEIPSVSVALSDGNALVAAIKSQDVTITVDKTPVIASIDTAGTVSSFSSTGASAELNFKPNVAGVGGTVYSTLPEYLGGWGVMSGTSMAAPYVAGSIALYRNAHKNKGTTQYINEQFQNYASARNVYGSTQIDNPIRQGAGLVQVYDAITQNTHISPAQISFNDTSSSKYKKQTITVTNSGSQTITYELYNNVSIGISPYDRKNTGYTFLEPVSTASAPAKLKFSSKKFKLGAGKSKKITITVTPPKTNPLDHIFYGGFIQLKSQQQSAAKDIHVPYFGVVGTQSDLPISDEGFPTILDNSSNEYLSNDTFIYDRSKNSTEPTVYIRLLTPTAKIKAELLDAKKKVIGEAFTGLIYLGRNFLTSAQYTGLPWDGTYVPTGFGASAVPIPAVAGDYYFRFSSLKLMADPKKSKSWEVWNSGKIVVKN
jgi:hypothetical protein